MADEVAPKPARKPRATRAQKAAAEPVVTEEVVTPETMRMDVFDPAHEAHRLRLGGMPWPQVARLTAYPSEDACRLAVRAYLTKAAAQLSLQQQQEALQEEIDRHEAMIEAFWMAARAGDEKAAAIVLQASRQIGKWKGLETKEAETTTTKTIVIAGSEEEYVRGLRSVIEGGQ